MISKSVFESLTNALMCHDYDVIGSEVRADNIKSGKWRKPLIKSRTSFLSDDYIII